jgi:hypothetical protein
MKLRSSTAASRPAAKKRGGGRKQNRWATVGFSASAAYLLNHPGDADQHGICLQALSRRAGCGALRRPTILCGFFHNLTRSTS